MNKRIVAIIGFCIVLILGYLLVEVVQGISNPAQHTYEQNCASCHGFEGEGLGDLIPPLAKADWLANNQDRLVCLIQFGMDESITVNDKEYNHVMYGMERMSAIQIANVINYINSSWGNDYGYIKVSEVEEQLKDCPPAVK